MIYLAEWVHIRDAMGAQCVFHTMAICQPDWRHQRHRLAQNIGVDMKKRTMLKLKVDVA